MTAHVPARIVRFIAVPALLLLALAAPGWSQVQSTGVLKEGGYVGVGLVPQFTFNGVTFDGESGYREVDGEELVVLPRVDKRNMFRVILGYRAGASSVEVSYDRSHLNGTFVGFPMKATFQALNVDGRYFFARHRRVQPHILVGGSFPMLNIKDGSVLREDFGDARFNGYGLNTEAGVTVYPHRRLGIGIGYSYRAMWFDRVKGVSDTLFELRPRFRETSGSVAISAFVH